MEDGGWKKSTPSTVVPTAKDAGAVLHHLSDKEKEKNKGDRSAECCVKQIAVQPQRNGEGPYCHKDHETHRLDHEEQ